MRGRSRMLIGAATLCALLGPAPRSVGPTPAAGADRVLPALGTSSSITPEVQWLEYGEALARAKQENKHLIVDFYTNWCGWCRRMDHDTYGDSSVATYLQQHFVLSKVNAESPKRFKVGDGTKSGIELARDFGVNSFPITWFIRPDGTKIDKLMGYQPPGPFRNVLVYVHERRYERK